MGTFLSSFVVGFNYFIGFYYGFVNLLYTLLMAAALIAIYRHLRRIRYSPMKELRSSPETPPVSILIAAHNEEINIGSTVSGALAMNYPLLEVIVINDGSSDNTLQLLIEAFGLRPIDLVYRDVLKTK